MGILEMLPPDDVPQWPNAALGKSSHCVEVSLVYSALMMKSDGFQTLHRCRTAYKVHQSNNMALEQET